MRYRTLALGFVLLLCGCGPSPDARIDQLDRDIRQQTPVGSSRPSVMAFLHSRGVTIDQPPAIAPAETRVIHARYATGGRFEVVRTIALLTFRFDDRDTLTSYQMTKQLVGP